MSHYQPKVSVVIPVYNVEKYLERCLDSVLGQTLHEIEVICVDDGSTDNSCVILEEYHKKDSRIQILKHEKNAGLLKTRKDGVLLAKGKGILFVDSDDYIETNACEILYQKMVKTGADIVAFGVKVEADEKNDCSELEQRYSMHSSYLQGRSIIRSCIVNRTCTHNVWNKFYDTHLCKRCYAEIPDCYCNMGEDACAFFVLACYAKYFVGIDDKLYHYSYGVGISSAPNSSTESFDRYCNQENVIQTIEAFLNSNGLFEEYRSEYYAIENRLLQYCIDIFFNLQPEQMDEGMNILVEHWGGQRVAAALTRRRQNVSGVEQRFANGELGMRCILKCCKAWLGFKIRRIRRK